METSHKIRLFEEMIDELTKDFAHHMFHEEWEEDTEDYYWVADDKTGTLEINDTWWGLGTIHEVLKNNYPAEIVHKWYNYTLDNSGEEREYWINLEHFVKMYDGSNLDEWAERYHKQLDKQRAYWNSPKWIAETEEQMKPLLEKFQEEIKQYTDNKK